MPALFPNSVRVYASKTDLVDTVLADHVNLLQDEVTAVERALGTGLLVSTWSGTFGQPTSHLTLTARLTNIEAGLASHAVTKFNTSGGTLTGALSGTSATFSAAVSAASFSGRYPANSTSSRTASFTLTAELTGTTVLCAASAAITITLPTNASLSLPVGTRVDIVQTGAGQVTVSGANGVTLRAPSGAKTRAQYAVAGLIKVSTDEWVLFGDTTEI